MYIPTQEQYLAALEVVKAYEFNQESILEDKIYAIKSRLSVFFNTVGITKFSIKREDWMGNKGVFIFPVEPCYDEDYCGEFDEELKRLSLEFGIMIKMDSSIYAK